MNDDIKVSMLKDEYLLLQRFYEDFDGRVVTIKGWSATITAAAIGGGFYQSKYLWLFAAGASLTFWLVESLWKSFQYMYAPRIQAIEQAFRNNSFDDIAPLQIHSSWLEEFRQNGFQLHKRFTMGTVCFPHIVTLIVGLLLFAFSGILHIGK